MKLAEKCSADACYLLKWLFCYHSLLR